MKTISLLDLCTFLGATPSDKNITEGEAIVNAGHIIFCGATKKLRSHISILACISTPTGKPYELTGEFKRHKSKIQIEDMTCSCEADMPKRCEHMAAVLIHCSRMDFNSMELFSAENLKCFRLHQKEDELNQYVDRPISEWKCLQRPTGIKRPEITKEEAESCLSILLDGDTESLLARHLKI